VVLRKLLGEAEQHVATVRVKAELFGRAWAGTDLEIVVDGRPAGALGLPIYLDPGPHALGARGPAVASTGRRIEAEAGANEGILLRLRLERTKASDATSPPKQVAAARPLATEPPAAESARPWWPIALGAGVALTGGVLGVTGTVLASSSSGDVASNAEQVARATGLDAQIVCSAPWPSVADACGAWRDAQARKSSSTALAVAGYAGLGAAVLATVLYASWPSDDEEPAPGARSSTPGARFTIRAGNEIRVGLDF
jgi:hypothetical protein